MEPMSMSSDPMIEHEPGKIKIRKSYLWIAFICAIISIIVVGALSGVLSANREKKLAEERMKSQNRINGSEKPSTQPTSTKAKSSTTTPRTQPTSTKAKSSTTTPRTQPTSTKAKSSTTTSSPCSGPWCSVRLPTNVIPEHYNLKIKADVKNLQFNGTQSMFVKVTNQTKYILFHYKEMNITDYKIHKLNGNVRESIQLKGGYAKPANEYFVIETSDEMQQGAYVIEVQFKAFVSTKLTGFYKSTYKNSMGKTRTLLTTKFQPTDARKAYPCLDEPDLKATFNITVIHPSEYNALSNMPITSTMMHMHWNVTTFAKTVRMSTYLIAFIVCDFDFKEGITGIKNDIKMGVYSSPPQVNATEYSLTIGINMTTFLEKFFNVRYPMPKLDFVAIPDYGSGATEHWGVITYRESRLLYTSGISSERNKQGIATIVAHELAHLWFGNLVTCKWWNDLWIQEGMASYIEYYAVNEVHPDWKMMEQFFVDDWRSGMALDALASSHPISQTVTHPKQIKEIFDTITYRKGSSILRMLDHYLGKDLFRNGLAEYLTKHQFKGATSDDLWQAFSNVSNLDIVSMMKTWTLQMGYPLINVTRDSNNLTQATVTQQHFLLDPKATVTVKSPYRYKWIVPLTYVTEDAPSTKQSLLLSDASGTLTGLSAGKWIKVNYMQTGFFRVTYSDSDWKMLINQLNNKHSVFSALDRAGIIDDAFNLARAGVLNYGIALNTTQYLEKEESYVVWRTALSNLNYLNQVLSARKTYAKFRKYMVQKLRPMVKKLGWRMIGSHLDKYKRSMFLSASCNYGDADAIAVVKDEFNLWMAGNITINSELQSLIYYHGVANGGDKEWDFVYSKFSTTSNPTEKSNLQSALSATQKPWILRKWLEYSLDSNIIRTQDTVYVITAVSRSNPVGKYIAWDFARANWIKCMEIMTPNNFHVTRMTLGITYQFTTDFELQQVREFWTKYPNAGAGARARIQGIERIKASIEWTKNYAVIVEEWLNSQVTS